MAESVSVASEPAEPGKVRLRWYQFSLRTLLVFVLLASVALSWLAVKLREAARQKAAVAGILKAGGTVVYDYQMDVRLDPARRATAEPRTPAWLRRLLGDDLFNTVQGVVFKSHDLGDANVEQAAEHLEALPELRLVNLSYSQITDTALKHVVGLTDVLVLELTMTSIGDTALAHLSNWKCLGQIHLNDTRITDAGLIHLKHVPRLKYISICRTAVTDAGLAHLRGHRFLEEVHMAATAISDVGLKHLRDLVHLEFVDVSYTGISDEGLAHLAGMTEMGNLSLRTGVSITVVVARDGAVVPFWQQGVELNGHGLFEVAGDLAANVVGAADDVDRGSQAGGG